MHPSRFSRIFSAVPERMPRRQSGTPFKPTPVQLAQDPQVAHLARLLHWLTPLSAINEEDQRVLGVLASHGRLAGQDDDDLPEGEREETAEPVCEIGQAVS